jgi:amino acid transporter
VLTVLAVWGMRRKHPELPRAFRVPGGKVGVALIILLPVLMTIWALSHSEPYAKIYGAAGLALGLVVYGTVWPFRKRAGKLS